MWLVDLNYIFVDVRNSTMYRFVLQPNLNECFAKIFAAINIGIKAS